MSCQTKMPPALVFLFLTNFIALVRAPETCANNGNYTRNSAYETNLNTLLSSLSTNMEDNGFYTPYEGQSPDRVNAIALCRGDVQIDFCRACIRNATVEIQDLCPNQRGATLWLEYCMIRYSDESIWGTLEIFPRYYFWNVSNATSPDEFMADRRSLLHGLRGQASRGGSFRKFAAGNRSTFGLQTIFGLVQCTPDLSPQDCNSCLITAAAQLPFSSETAIGLRVLLTSCNIRYEIYPFYNETGLQELAPVVPRTQQVPQPPVPSTPPLIPTPQVSLPSGNDVNNTTRTIIIVVVLVALCVILVISAGFFFRKRIKQKPKEEVDIEEISFVESLQCDFRKIRAATDDFAEANKLGEGGFGSVYKGKFQNDQEIAVKKLSKGSGQGDLEFKNEVMLLARLQHKNLVRLLGFSVEGREKLLVYEFVQNASLDNFIFDETKRSYLDWSKRYKIICGIARGILYLHEDSRLMIIHRDLKASNVLLDGRMNPKIADFGLARLFIHDETQGSTNRIVGTYGYMAPEYAMYGQFSAKSDVFSFGVLVLEIISGQKNSCVQNGENVEHILTSTWKHWREGTTENLIDPLLIKVSTLPQDILRCIHIGLLCVQESIAKRPTMAWVVQMLNSFSITLPLPSEPSLFMTSVYDSEASLLQESKLNEVNRDKQKENKTDNSSLSSQNEMSVTELYPR